MIDSFLSKATALRASGDIAGAIASIKSAIAAAPEDPRGYSRLAHLSLESFDYTAARGAFENAVRLMPSDVGYRNNYGMMLIYVGDFAAARAQFRHVIAIDAACAPAYYNLAPITPISDAAALAEDLEKLKAGAETDLDHCLIGFALGKLYDDLGEWDLAFENFATGNTRKGARYDHAVTQTLFSASKAAFSGPRANAATSAAARQQTPIFIVGMPRCGSSLIEDMLARRTGVTGLGERSEIPGLVTMVRDRHASRLKFPWCAPHLTSGELGELADRYFVSVNRQAKGAPFVIDKQLLNFQYAPLLGMMFPSAAILHCVRNPIDTCLSTYFTNFQSGFAYSFDLADLGAYYRAHHDLMTHYQSILADALVTVQYEEVVARKEAVISGLADRLGLPRSPAVEREEPPPRNIRTSSAWQVRQPVYTHAIKRWKNYEKHLGPLIDSLGDLAT
ncbi:MAG: sulfotransferase [Parvularculaceae bacterium]